MNHLNGSLYDPADPRARIPTEVFCGGKDQLTRQQATDIARRGHRRKGGKVSPYLCPACGHFHVGQRMVKTENMGRRG